MTASLFRCRRVAAPRRSLVASLLLLLVAGLAPSLASSAVVGVDALPAAVTHDLLPLSAVPRHEAPRLDAAALAVEDVQRERDGLPLRFAVPEPVALTPDNAGVWEPLADGQRVWRLRVTSPGAVSLNLGFTQYRLPPAGRLCIYPTSDPVDAIAFTAADNAVHGQLWTPIVPGDDLVIELTLPEPVPGGTRLELGSVNVGYRDFGRLVAEKSGACNVDVICPEGDAWRDEIQSVAVYSRSGSLACTGFLVNNTAQDAKPLFLTAAHCGVYDLTAASLVVYWNFFSPTCGEHGGGSLSQFQSGSVLRAANSTSDFTLVELDEAPDPAWNVTFAGWNRADAAPTRATCIHHPSSDEKSISFDNDPLQVASYYVKDTPGDGTHLRVLDWDVGTTEPGSSGSPLFDQDHRVVGQLHGGDAACGNDESDWFGRFFTSWTGGGTSATRLSDWLDPLATGQTTLDLYAPYAPGLRVEPEGTAGELHASGPSGGPFTPSSLVYTLTNVGTDALDFVVTHNTDNAWLTITPAAGRIRSGRTATVTVALNAWARYTPPGVWADTLGFINATRHTGDQQRRVTLQIGAPELAYAWTLDTDPGWTLQGQWAFGEPLGSGGLSYGVPDPAAGHTGANVLGYNLSGDYAANLLERNLTTTTIDCSGLRTVTLRFWRWLGVEQPAADGAAVRVSNDGVNWTTIWQNPAEIGDVAWTQQEFDISAVAARQPEVRVRWTMGTTNATNQSCGWNIDDIELWGYPYVPPVLPPERTALLGNVPNPFNAATDIVFDLAQPGTARLSLFDLRGRLVRVLVDEELPAVRHTFTWNGRDADGRAVAGGVYVLRLEAGGIREQRKLTLAK